MKPIRLCLLSLPTHLLVLLLLSCPTQGDLSRTARDVDVREPSRSEKISYAAQQAAAASVATVSFDPKETRFSEKPDASALSPCVTGCLAKCVSQCMGNPSTDNLCTEDCRKYCRRDCQLRLNEEYPGTEKKLQVKFLPPIQFMSSDEAVLPHQSRKMDSRTLGPKECEPHCNFECNSECERKYEFPWKCPAECKRDCSNYCKPLTTGSLNNGDKLVQEDEEGLSQVLRPLKEHRHTPNAPVRSGNLALRWLSAVFTLLCACVIVYILYRLYGGKTYVAMYSKDKS
mmetsp:Transcript_22677/g.51125  ORF Transcript_22677/g.51125 Transcript_22677/m.51125 type:complete len:286 (-) Transcript_22677:120-977(-)